MRGRKWRAMAAAVLAVIGIGSVAQVVAQDEKAASPSSASASAPVQVSSIVPRGEVAEARQVRLQFSRPVIRFGDPRLPAPATLSCEGAAVEGAGRWADARTWVYDLRNALPPGTRCRVQLRAEWKPLDGSVGGTTTFEFSTAGPAVLSISPYEGATIAEDQYFLLRLSGAVQEASLGDGHAWCEVEGLGEKIPVRVIGGAERAELLKARHVDAAIAPRMLVLACGRPLPNDAAVRLVWGRGIVSAASAGVATRVEQRHAYTVRAAFTASFSCEREKSGAPCLPIRPMRLTFSAPVARDLAAGVRLKPATGEAIAPRFDADDRRAAVSELVFAPPLADSTRYTIELPPGIVDDAGRRLSNASTFPLAVATGAPPPIAKFAAAPFGIVERGDEAVLPVTLRHVQGDLAPAAPGGSVRIKRLESDADILAWYARLRRYDETEMTARELGLPSSAWYVFEDTHDARGKPVRRRVERRVGTREVPLLKNDATARRLDLPQLAGGDPRPFEVVGIPLAEPGYQVVEIESARLGRSLLDKAAPMYVRTGVLVTDLGVHFKQGRESSLVWVTTLAGGRPVEGADVVVNDCRGRPLWQGRTDAQGLAPIARRFEPGVQNTECPADDGYFVTARLARPGAPTDTSFVFSSWQKGIESWRFNLPTASGAEPDLRAWTVFDRTLLRVGETVSMKHFVRSETSAGLAALRPEALPTQVRIVHQGTGQEFVQPLVWQGARSATTSWAIPTAAKLGTYDVMLESGEGARKRQWQSGDFRVEAFRVPLVDARLSGPKGVTVAPDALTLDLRLGYFSGGAMAGAPVAASALLKDRSLSFPGYEAYAFDPPRDPASGGSGDEEAPGENAPEAGTGKLVADRIALTTDAQGVARFAVPGLPKLARPAVLEAEATFNDPNGEVQTVSTRVDLWPSAVVLGIRTGAWASGRGRVQFNGVALDTAGRPVAGQAVEVRGRLHQVESTRKRLVGGFYAYDNRTELKELGTLCQGQSDARGLVLCEAELNHAGQVELVARAVDGAGHATEAATSVWITRQGELWFAQDNDDRIDLLPEKRRYEPGETARLQVRMPFRQATALVTVEREGVITSRVVSLRGDDPTIEVPIDGAWAPNVYVSVLALRGRVRDTPWYSFFTWGWKAPVEWARSYWYDGREYQAPTAMVDLAKPSFKLGVAALEVGSASHRLDVTVTADKTVYQVREKARARIKVAFQGRPLAGAEVAFAAVDEGLLALRDNTSWDLLDGLLQPRGWGVETSTAQGEIIGRRHYGRKAVPPGGGGGHGATRELFDTLLVWQPRVRLDAQGEAVVDVPLNDSLTSFRFVAVADAGDQQFGTGSTQVRVSQDLQVLAGLPPLVRDGDRFSAMLTLRNTTAREMKVRVSLAGTPLAASPTGVPDAGAASTPSPSAGTAAQAGASAAATAGASPGAPASVSAGTPAGASPSTPAGASPSAPAGARVAPPAATLPRITLPPQDVVLAAGAAREIAWPVDVPADAGRIAWEAAAEEQGGAARDRLRVTQAVDPAVPLRVLQATLAQLDGRYELPAAAPADALPASGPRRGGIDVALQPTLAGTLPGVRRFFETYPYTCLEQQTSKAIGLPDASRWAAVAQALPTYLDSDGLANYFPPRAEDAAHGSDRLTAYLLAATHEAGYAVPDGPREAMLGGLTAFVQGRIERRFWSPRPDLDVRKLAAIEALSRYGRAEPRMLDSINMTPTLWPTAALVDWLRILQRLDGVPDAVRRRDEAQQLLRSRLVFAGNLLRFDREEGDAWWWLMDNADANAARLVLAVVDEPAWRDELPRIVIGALARQRGGAWLTTTANAWGSLALRKFAAKFESEPLGGRSVAAWQGARAAPAASSSAPASTPASAPTSAPASAPASASVSPRDMSTATIVDWARQPGGGSRLMPWPSAPATLAVLQQGTGKPWLTLQSLAAVPLKAPREAGYRVTRSVVAVQRKEAGRWSRGDIVRVRLEVDAVADMAWVVVADPVPGGATVLGSGLGRDSAIATRTERRAGDAYPAFEERGPAAFRSYYEFLPRGHQVVEYTMRLNNPGRFALPPTRVEAMYAPDAYGEAPNAALEVGP